MELAAYMAHRMLLSQPLEPTSRYLEAHLVIHDMTHLKFMKDLLGKDVVEGKGSERTF